MARLFRQCHHGISDGRTALAFSGEFFSSAEDRAQGESTPFEPYPINRVMDLCVESLALRAISWRLGAGVNVVEACESSVLDFCDMIFQPHDMISTVLGEVNAAASGRVPASRTRSAFVLDSHEP